MDIREYLKSNILIMDGAMGTYYDSFNKEQKEAVELANLTDRDTIKKIHRQYIKSGAKMIRTNTFSSNLNLLGSKQQVTDNIIEAVRIAREAVAESGRDVFISASIGPIPEEPNTDESIIEEEYKWICDTFLTAGCKIFVFETFSNYNHLAAVCDYIKSKGDYFIITQFSLNKMGYTKDGISMQRLVQVLGQMDSIDSYGFNCGIGASHLNQLLKNISFPGNKPLTALPNSGYPHIVRRRTIYSDSPAYFAEKMQEVVKQGANIVGGCCGTNPKYIKDLTDTIDTTHIYPKVIREIISDAAVMTKEPNSFINKLNRGEKVIAVELDPPYNEDASKLITGAYGLADCDVDMITIADSPLARSRADSLHMSFKLQQDVGCKVMPHICCRDKNRISMRSQMLGAHINGIRNLLIITGDPVGPGDRDSIKSVFDFNSIKLMEYIKEMNVEHFQKDPLYYGGALNYTGVNIDAIIGRMNKKIEAGCSYFLTQPIYSDNDIKRIQQLKEKVNTKILCGIMPLVSYRNAMFIKNEMPGIFVPDEILNQYQAEHSRTEAEQVAVRVSLDIIKKLDGIADGFYFMTPFNRVSLISTIIKQMN